MKLRILINYFFPVDKLTLLILQSRSKIVLMLPLLILIGLKFTSSMVRKLEMVFISVIVVEFHLLRSRFHKPANIMEVFSLMIPMVFWYGKKIHLQVLIVSLQEQRIALFTRQIIGVIVTIEQEFLMPMIIS